MLHRWRKGGKPAFVSDEVWQSWQHQWSDASFQSIRERQSRNRHSETGGPGSGMSRHGCGSISLAEHARRIVRIHTYIYIYIFYIFKNVSISAYLISNVFILGNEGGCPSK